MSSFILATDRNSQSNASLVIGMLLMVVSMALCLLLYINADQFLNWGGYVQIAMIYVGCPLGILGMIFGAYLIITNQVSDDPLDSEIDSDWGDEDGGYVHMLGKPAANAKTYAQPKLSPMLSRVHLPKDALLRAYLANEERRFVDTIAV